MMRMAFSRDELLVRLEALGYALPTAPEPLAVYVPAVENGGQVWVSGQLPLREGQLVAQGRVGEGVDLEAAQQAAQQCALNVLAAVDQALEGDWQRFERLLKLEVFVAGAPEFTEQHLVANGASELLGAALAPGGVHARAAVGVASLPLNAPVEIAAIVQCAK